MPKHPSPDIHFRTCNLCEAMCGIKIEHQYGKVLSVKGDENDPLSRGHICPKAVALQDIYEDTDRLKKPIKKTADGWEEISWKTAYDEVARGIDAIRRANGNNGMAVYSGNPSVHNYGTILFGGDLTRALKTKNNFSATSVDQLPHHFASQFMLGHWLLLPVPDIDRTNYFLVFGANPIASNGSLMTAPDIGNRIKTLQKRGGKMIVIDPRETETAKKADEHHFIQPGTDVLFLLALLNVILTENLTRLGVLESIVKGFEKLPEIIKPYTPEKVEKTTRIPADEIIRIAREFASATTAVCYGRMGVSTQQFGTVCNWLIYVLNIVTGNFDKAGGAMFSTPAVEVVRGGSTIRKFGRWKSKVRGLPEFMGELPVAALAEEILNPDRHGIKGLIVSAGNPVLSTPNGKQLEKALEKLDFMVSIDIYLNETSRHADIILPPATGLETDHYDLIFHNLAVRDTVKYSPALFTPEKGTQYDWQIYKTLAKMISQRKVSLFQKWFQDWKTPTRVLNLGLLTGSYGKWRNRRLHLNGLSLTKVKKHPNGIDLGPLKPCLPQRLRTPDKKIDLSPKVITDDIERIRKVFFQESENSKNGFIFSLIGRRHLRSNNSWMHNTERLVKGANRCTLMMHPLDAKKLKVENRQRVEVTSAVGKVKIELEVTEEIFPGVVSIPHGYGHHREGIRLQVAERNAGVSINDLSDEYLLDELSGNAAFSGTPVRVEEC